MTDTQGGEAAAVETTVDATIETATQEQAAERDYEAEARSEGWVPETEFKGNKRPAKFLSAQEFVERGELFAPFRKRIEKQVEERVSKIEKVHERTLKTLQAQHDKEIAGLKAERKTAIKAGNVEEVERIEARIETLADAAPTKVDTKTDDDVQADWMARNAWYAEDEDLATVALGYSNRIRSPELSLEENLKRTEEYIKKKFPEKFGSTTKPAANAHAAVDGGGHAPGGLKSDPLAKLPAEARAQAKSDMAKYPKVYPNAEAWAKAYNS